MTAASEDTQTNDVRATIYPALSYRDAAAAIEWLTDAFGFAVLMAMPGPDGTIGHAELRLGDGIIMLGSAQGARGWLSPRDLPGVNQTIYVYVADLDAHDDRAVAAGATIMQPLHDTDYGSRGYAATDCEGHQWSFGTYRPGS